MHELQVHVHNHIHLVQHGTVSKASIEASVVDNASFTTIGMYDDTLSGLHPCQYMHVY